MTAAAPALDVGDANVEDAGVENADVDDAWLEAMLDARSAVIVTGAVGSALEVGFGKLSLLQNAFSQLQWAELQAPLAYSVGQFQWGHLQVLAQLDAGGDADVFRAHDAMLQREVALKLRRAANDENTIADAAFIAKTGLLAKVRHPNMLAVHGAAVELGRAGFWMDFIDGETLSARLQSSGALRAATLLRLLTELAGALSALHTNDVVHGAINAQHVMCERATERFVLMDIATPQTQDFAQAAASDIAQLAALVTYAAGPTTETALSKFAFHSPLGANFRALLRAMRHSDVTQRPSAQSVLTRCYALMAEPEQRRKRRWRSALQAALLASVIASSAALLYALHSRALARQQRDQAVATQDFLMTVLRSPNPAQNPNAAHGVVQVFEQAAAAVPKAFSADPNSAALLLLQFGRALQVSEAHVAALAALQQADQYFAQAGLARSDPSRIETQSFMIASYRAQRDYGQSMVLANAQAKLCAPPSEIAAVVCLGVFNDQILASEARMPLAQLLVLLAQNLRRAGVALDALNVVNGDSQSRQIINSQAANSLNWQGLFQRELGQSQQALRSNLLLSKTLLASANAPGAGVLNVLGPLALSADELGDSALAIQLNAAALRGLTQLYGSDSRRTFRLELQAVTFALHARDGANARARLRRILALPASAANSTWLEQASVLSAMAGDVEMSNARLVQIEQSRANVLGEDARALVEFRLNLAAVALQRGNAELARQLLAKTQRLIDSDDGAGMRPLYLALTLNVMRAQSSVARCQLDLARMAVLQRQLDALLGLQARQLFDPVRAVWLGPAVPDANVRLAQIKAAAAQIAAFTEAKQRQANRARPSQNG
jgi:tRNA A-37 threonylcarbamoyl transferase component Bud32